MNSNRIKDLTPYLFLSVAIVLAISLILYLNQGIFSYSLDDAYIHLRLADSITQGTYGLNLNEAASPSSSILWPFLLIPLMAIGLGQFAPLILNVLAAFAVVRAVSLILDECMGEASQVRRGVKAILIIVFILGTSLVGLVLTGMEHTLQVYLALLILLGLLRSRDGARFPWWFHMAVILGPCIRYESLVLSLPALVYLVYCRKAKAAILDGLCITLVLAGFSVMLISLGLPWLPSSVIVKSQLAHGGSLLGGLASNFVANISYLDAIPFLAAIPLILWQGIRSKDRFDRLLSGIVGGAVLAYLAAGPFGGFSRYQMFLWAVVLLWLAYLYRRPFGDLLGRRPALGVSVLAAGVLLVCAKYAATSVLTPLASNNIFDQQYQMHRFVTTYLKGPVAVNDIGWVAYSNDDYVLDLFGLASPEAWADRTSHPSDVEWMNDLCTEKGVRLAMIYPERFAGIPDNWVELGYLRLDRWRVASAFGQVHFYAVSAQDVEQLRTLLAMFARDLPPGATFWFKD
jgi:hypothetical protein